MQFKTSEEISRWLGTPPAAPGHVPTTEEAPDSCLLGRLDQDITGLVALTRTILAIDPRPATPHPAFARILTEISVLSLKLEASRDQLAEPGTEPCEHDHDAAPTAGVSALGGALLVLARGCGEHPLEAVLPTHREQLVEAFDKLDEEIRRLVPALVTHTSDSEDAGDQPRHAALAVWLGGAAGWVRRSARIRASLGGSDEVVRRLQNAIPYPNVRCDRGPDVDPQCHQVLIDRLRAGERSGQVLRALVADALPAADRQASAELECGRVAVWLERWTVELERIRVFARISLRDSWQMGVTLEMACDPDPEIDLRITVVGID